MITDVDGIIADVISLEDKATKGRSGKTIPMNKTLKSALIDLLKEPQEIRESVQLKDIYKQMKMLRSRW